MPRRGQDSNQERSRAAEIRAIGIGKTFGAFRALKNVSLEIGSGEFLTLLGPSGSGKTTFLMILAGFQAPSEGRLITDGVDVTAKPAEERSYGMVFQGYALFPHMSVEANIAFPLQVRRVPSQEIRRRVAEMIERVGLIGHEKKLPAKLSGGQQQRVALARALVFEPGVLLLDEPFSALDKSLRELMQVEVKRLHQETGTTFVFVTHDQGEALALSSRVAIFDHGELLQVGAPRDVYEKPSSRFVAEFLGEINLLPLGNVRCADGGATARCEDRLVTVRGVGKPTGPQAVLAIRPEHMSLSLQAPPADDNSLPASVEMSTYLGAATRLELKTRGNAKVVLSVPTHTISAGLSRGSPAWVTWPADQGFLLPSGGGR
ncbi:putative spermidine/putrescine transport system ATP-binding protein [Rhizobiales bacterium GAS191]|jgi:putative spermidine/putrescine transport system ATP-binding protein|nr:putative spermidine/putrescine transport system ATP-binding protein [Rhizobiales bacterium GAS113]SEE78080.1 putative spermidine/putrescine transport system ATP-binding protein [Rhizobiales bacterium GAS191]